LLTLLTLLTALLALFALLALLPLLRLALLTGLRLAALLALCALIALLALLFLAGLLALLRLLLLRLLSIALPFALLRLWRILGPVAGGLAGSSVILRLIGLVLLVPWLGRTSVFGRLASRWLAGLVWLRSLTGADDDDRSPVCLRTVGTGAAAGRLAIEGHTPADDAVARFEPQSGRLKSVVSVKWTAQWRVGRPLIQ
jgi:hypothetical protein